ncbi:MAG TPA: MFS transporter [Acidimicrobiales bacterium]|nr:MFS transporter [Acidimicrobiales bacterium]
MLILILFGLAVASVPAAGGRLTAIADVRLRRWPLLAGAMGVQLVAVLVGLPDPAPQVLHLASYALGGAYLVANLHVPGVWLVGIGGGSNLAAIAANGGVMPASPAAVRAAGLTDGGGEFVNSAASQSPHLGFLGDVIVVPDAVPWANVFSIGDVLLLAGLVVALHRLSGSRLLRPGPGHLAALGRERRFVAVAAAQVLTSAGTWAVVVAAAFVAGGSRSSSAGSLLAAETLAVAGTAGLWGPLVDRLGAPALLTLAAAVRAAAAASLLVGHPTPTRVATVATVLAGAEALAGPAARTAVARVIDPARLLAANGLLTTAFLVPGMVAVGVASRSLAGIDPAALVGPAAAAFLVAAALLSTVPLPAPRHRRRSTLWTDLLEGIDGVLGRADVAVLLGVSLAIAFAVGMGMPDAHPALGLAHRRVAAASPAAGSLLVGLTIGAMGATLVAARRTTLVTAGLAVAGGGALAATLVGGWPAPPLWMVAGAGLGLAVVALTTLVQVAGDPARRGRTLSIVLAVSTAAFGIGHQMGVGLRRSSGRTAAWSTSSVVLAVAAIAAYALFRRFAIEPSVAGATVDETDEIFTGSEAADVVADAGGERGPGHLGGVGGVRGDDAVVEPPQGVAVGERLGIGDVEGGTADALLLEHVDEVVGDDVRAAGDVDQPRMVVHAIELVAPDDADGLRREGEREDHEVGAGEHLIEAIRADGPCRTCQWLGLSADDCCLHAEGGEQGQQRLGDPTATEDRHPAVVQAPTT